MPSIIYVDDDAVEYLDSLSQDIRAAFHGFDPRDELQKKSAFEAASRSDLWVFDFFYSEDHRPESALEQENGLMTFHRWRRAKHEERPPAALISSDLERAIGPLVPLGREHVLAQRAGVEWVGAKTAESGNFLLKLGAASAKIQAAVAALTAKVDDKKLRQSNEAICLALLNIPQQSSWLKSAERELDRIRPPILSSVKQPEAKARLLLGWLLNSVLPYPSFLLNSRHASARLGITDDSLQSILRSDADCNLKKDLRAAAYTGPLGDTAAEKFWRAGIDDIVWNISQGDGSYSERLREAASPNSITLLGVDDPVVVSDPDLIETRDVASAQECVRVQDEYFPPGIPPAWVKLNVAREHAELADKVIFEDRGLLDAS